MRNSPNHFVLKRANYSQKYGMEKIGAESTVAIDAPAASGPEVEASVFTLLGDPAIVFFTLVILQRNKYWNSI